MHKKVALLAVLSMLAGLALAQGNQQNPPASGQQSTAQSAPQVEQPAQSGKPAPSDAQAKPKDEKTEAAAKPAPAQGQTPVTSTKIPSGSKIYVAPMGGFENYVVAGIVKKKVPVVIVADRDKADYEIRGAAETERAGWAKIVFIGSDNSNEQASVTVVEIKSGSVVYAYSVHKSNSFKGKQSAGEAIGKHLNEVIGKD
jgi:hypothetical protein